MLLAGRLLTGAALGYVLVKVVMVTDDPYVLCSIFYMVMPVYIAEMSPKEHRGTLASIIGQTFNLGILVALCLNVGFAKFCEGWRVAFAIVVLLGLIFTIGMLFLPHTPR